MGLAIMHQADREELSLEACGALLSEREYQEKLWNSTESGGKHSVTEFLVYISHYVRKALDLQSTIPADQADEESLHSVRKIGALVLACMEQNGIRYRDIEADLKTAKERHKIK